MLWVNNVINLVGFIRYIGCWSVGRSWSRPVCRSRGGTIGWDWSWSIGRLGLSRENCLTLILDISNITIFISSVGHNLGTGVRKDNTVRSTGPVSITALRVSKVVGVGVTHSILKVVLGSSVSIDLNWSWSIGRFRSWGIRWCWSWSWCWGIGWCWGRSRGWSICWCWSWSVVGALRPGKGNCSNG